MGDLYRVNIADRALADLRSIFHYIQQDSPSNAVKVIEKTLTAIHDLELMPERFRRAGRSRKYGNTIHARVVRPFIVYFRIDRSNREVFVLEIRHGARKQPRYFG